MQNKFEPGDVVELVTGGPKMTVAYRTQPKNTDEEYRVVWFDDQKHIQDLVLPAAVLRKVTT